MPSDLDVASPWHPIPPRAVAALMEGANFFWCLAGGYSVERFVGHSYREHADTDIVVLRRDHLAAQSWLHDWTWYAADPPGTLRRWELGETLPARVHDTWGHREGKNAWELQLMIQDSDGDTWRYRRDDRVRGDLLNLAPMLDGIPCLRIELQLLYKSKGLRPKDRLDFEQALPRLSDEQRNTLATWMGSVYPDGHPWLTQLIA